MAAELDRIYSVLPGVPTSGTGEIPRENRGYHGCLSEPSSSSLKLRRSWLQMPVMPAVSNEVIAEEVAEPLNKGGRR